MKRASKHDLDFHAWAVEQAGLLRAGRLAEADIAHIAEEIETLGRGERRELVNRLAVLCCTFSNGRISPSGAAKAGA